MPLEMKTVGRAVHFRYDDGEATTVVVVSSEDDDGAKVRKLKRVIALVEGEQLPVAVLPASVREFLGPQRVAPRAPEPAPALPAHLRGQWDLEEPAGPVGKGWEAMGDELPSAPGEGA